MSPPVDGGRWDARRAHPEVHVLEHDTVFQSSGNGFRTCLCKRVMRDNGGYIARIQVRGISNFLVGVAMPDVEVGRSGEDRVEFCGRQGWGFTMVRVVVLATRDARFTMLTSPFVTVGARLCAPITRSKETHLS